MNRGRKQLEARAERAGEELRQLFGVLPLSERPTDDVDIDADALLARIFTAIDSEEARTHAVEVTERSQSRRQVQVRRTFVQRWALAGVAAVILVAVLVVMNIGGAPRAVAGTPQPLRYSLTQPEELTDAADASEALLRLAAAASNATPALSAPLEASVQLVESYGWFFNTANEEASHVSVVQPVRTRSWLAADGSVRINQYRSQPLTNGGNLDPAPPATAAGPEATDEFPAATLDATTPSLLPPDPTALRVALLAFTGGADACTATPEQVLSCLVTTIRTIFAQHVIPADLAAAMWTVLASEPDLKDLGTTTDRAGRAAHAIAFNTTTENTSIVTVLLIRPEDGQLLGTETVTLADPALGLERPAVTAFETFTAREWVAQIGDIPTQ